MRSDFVMYVEDVSCPVPPGASSSHSSALPGASYSIAAVFAFDTLRTRLDRSFSAYQYDVRTRAWASGRELAKISGASFRPNLAKSRLEDLKRQKFISALRPRDALYGNYGADPCSYERIPV